MRDRTFAAFKLDTSSAPSRIRAHRRRYKARMFLLEVLPVNIRASLRPCELHAEVTSILGQVPIFAVPRKPLALSKRDTT